MLIIYNKNKMRIFKSRPLISLVNGYLVDSPQPSNNLLLRNGSFITSKTSKFSTHTKLYVDENQQSNRTVEDMTNSPVDRSSTNEELFDKLKITKRDSDDCMFTGELTRKESSSLRKEISDYFNEEKKNLDPDYAKGLEQQLKADTLRLTGLPHNPKSKDEENELARMTRESARLLIATQKLNALKDNVAPESKPQLDDLQKRADSLSQDFTSVSNGLVNCTAKAEKLRELLLVRGVSLTSYSVPYEDTDMDYFGDL